MLSIMNLFRGVPRGLRWSPTRAARSMLSIVNLLRGVLGFSPKEKTIHELYPQYSIGRGTYGAPRVFEGGEGAKLEIGAYCSIADGVTIFLGCEHRVDWVTTYPFSIFWDCAAHVRGHPATKGDVIIGNDVWIGYRATILSGVRIEDGAVIGCHSVVTKHVPAYGIVAGNPAKLIRTRFSEETIHRLLRARWWSWDEKRIRDSMPLLLSSDIESFLAIAEEGIPP